MKVDQSQCSNGGLIHSQTMLANEMQIIQIAANVIPQPIPSAIQNNAILFAIVIVWLIFAPGRFQYDIAYKRIQLPNDSNSPSLETHVPISI